MTPDAPDDALQTFLETLPENVALTARTLAHAWEGGGGEIHPGRMAVRLLGGIGWTAATIYGGDKARLELCRVIMEHHSVPNDAWVHWSDEFADLAHHGFDAKAKYPSVPLTSLTDGELVRLVTGLRDLAHMVC